METHHIFLLHVILNLEILHFSLSKLIFFFLSLKLQRENWIIVLSSAMAHSLNFLPLFFTLLLSTAVVFSSEFGGEELDDGDPRRREADRVVNLPDQPPVEFRHYAGYIKLRASEEKALFYWFFEAQNDVALKPLVLWLNGGSFLSLLFCQLWVKLRIKFWVRFIPKKKMIIIIILKCEDF